tara:strand:- start:146 stop:946 length:801 start_codon:yes stop_codon:yes gene_type:complete
MAYIGRSPLYGSFEKQSLSSDGSTTTFTLNYTVGSSSSILVSIAGVVQQPEVAYNLSSGGTQIVFAAAPGSSDTVFVIYLGISLEVATIGTGTVTGQTAETSVADDDLILIYDTSASALRKMTKANFTGSIPAANLTGTIATARLGSGTASSSTFLAGDQTFKTIEIKDIQWQAVITSNTTMVAGRGYFVNTTSGAITMTLPSSATIGDTIQVIDYAATADTNNITIGRNSHKIQGDAADLVVTTERAAFALVYVDATQGWLLDSK